MILFLSYCSSSVWRRNTKNMEAITLTIFCSKCITIINIYKRPINKEVPITNNYNYAYIHYFLSTFSTEEFVKSKTTVMKRETFRMKPIFGLCFAATKMIKGSYCTYYMQNEVPFIASNVTDDAL